MLSKNAITVLEKRYLRRDEHGALCESPEQLFERVARALAEPDRLHGARDEQVEATARKFYDLTYNLDFLPNSPTLANAGARLGQLSACFVLPVPDDLAGIFEAVKQAALIHQTGGGTGFAFSRLRPKNDIVNSTKGVSSGPIPFMDVFNAATESIKQGGMRRGANMGILRVDHPDILAFVQHKEDLSKLTNFNISVAVTDAFMAALAAGADYHLVNPRTGERAGTLSTRLVFDEVVQRAWSTGEPGVIFIDRMNDHCPVPWMGSYEATNPCGEQPLIPFESCNLGSINLERFVVDTPAGAEIDWPRMADAIHAATHLLDNVIDANHYPLEEIGEVTHATRKIGLGVMGFARMLFKLGVDYGSPESFALAEQVMSWIDFQSKVASVGLARERGAFPARRGEHEGRSNQILRRWCDERAVRPHRHPDANYGVLIPLIERHGIRNSTTTTVAPTGTLSIIADTSGGCEPAFALAFKRRQADSEMLDVDGVFREAIEAGWLTSEAHTAILAEVDAHHGSLREAIAAGAFATWAARDQEALEHLGAIFVVAHDLTPAEHIYMQAAFQAYNDSATSKTINFAESATPADVEEAYLLAYKTGCKGVTVYRNNCRAEQPLSTTPVAAPASPVLDAAIAFAKTQAAEILERERAPRRRPKDLFGFTREVETGEGTLYAVVNYDGEGVREVFTTVGRSGGTLYAMAEAIGRLISLALKFRVPADKIAGTLRGIRGANPFGMGPGQVLSIPDAIGRVLADAPRHIGGPTADAAAPVPAPSDVRVTVAIGVAAEAVRVYGKSPECPECGGALEFGEGCQSCRGCGYSKCG